MLTCDRYETPASLKEALLLWRDAPEGSRLVAGATDILPWAREGRAGDVHLPMMIDVTRIAELDGYKVEGNRIRLGANIVYQQFLTDETLRRLLPPMPYCSIWFADDQIREQATLVGNIVNASPAGDGVPPMVALNAEVEIAGLDGDTIVTRTVPVTDFITGPGKITLGEKEIVTAIHCDALEGYGGSFEKVGQRRSLVISVACATACVKLDASGETIEDLRVAIGGVGPVPSRLSNVEKALIGQKPTADLIATVSAEAASLVGSRSRKEYRRSVITGFVRVAIEDALADAGMHLPNSIRRQDREDSHV